jgi:hypothetical protein
MVTKILTAPVTRDININTISQLHEDSKVMDNNVIANYFSPILEGVTLLYDWASCRLTLRLGYKTQMLSETDDNLFAVFKVIMGEFYPEEEELNETYPEKVKH